MPHPSDPTYRLRRNLNMVLGALRRHVLIIAAVTVLTALFGAYIGHSATNVSSTAQLVLTPHPLRQNYDVELSVENFSDDDGALARMFAFPMEPKTASLICMSDAVLSATLEQLKGEGLLTGPIGSLSGLRGSLHVEMNLDIETIEEIKYSPILLLTGTAKNPADARILANTWAAQCVEGVRQYQHAKQQPHEESFGREVERIHERLETAEARLDTFGARSGDEAVSRRAEHIKRLVDAMQTQKRRTLQRQSESGKDAPADAEFRDFDQQLEAYRKELDVLEKERGQGPVEERRFRREADILAEVYKDAASKHEYIRLAGALDTPQVNLLSEGAEWGAPGSRKTVIFALIGALWGFLAVAFLFAGVSLLMAPAEHET